MIAVDIIKCPCCFEKTCIETKSDHLSLWSCQTCGYQTNSHMKIDSEIVEKQNNSLPNLLKDLRKEINGLVWYLNIVNLEGLGMVFPDGTDITDWKWHAVLSVPVPEEDKPKYKNAEFRTDMSTSKFFDQKQFKEALEYIGMYNQKDE